MKAGPELKWVVSGIFFVSGILIGYRGWIDDDKTKLFAGVLFFTMGLHALLTRWRGDPATSGARQTVGTALMFAILLGWLAWAFFIHAFVSAAIVMAAMAWFVVSWVRARREKARMAAAKS
jgi:hypothetical protein